MRLFLAAILILAATVPLKATVSSRQDQCAELMDQAMDAGVDIPDCDL